MSKVANQYWPNQFGSSSFVEAKENGELTDLTFDCYFGKTKYLINQSRSRCITLVFKVCVK